MGCHVTKNIILQQNHKNLDYVGYLAGIVSLKIVLCTKLSRIRNPAKITVQVTLAVYVKVITNNNIWFNSFLLTYQ